MRTLLVVLVALLIGGSGGYLIAQSRDSACVAALQQARADEQRQQDQQIENLREMNERAMQGHPR